ncbi:aldehyde dehydrogenase family protein [Nonomuraea sp. H19]|uniref:aldehyde dehydrogenase family protein n=1 Tax=Nonomuraea sp. H19 TaxID=3452206 RepID=UPI003F887A8F
MTITDIADNRLILNGREVDALSGESFERVSPAHDVVVARYAQAGAEDVDRAVAAARQAFDDGPWPRRAGVERFRVLRRVADLIRRDREHLARLEVLESGKPISQALDEVDAAAELWDYAATLARHAYGDAHNDLGADVLAMVVNEPLGVVSIITPWNFPLLIVSQKLPFALAVGCTAVVKPSELTPGTTLHLARLVIEAGADEGVVNVVTGSGGVGAAMAAHPGADMVSFTGSTAVGREVAASAGRLLKRVELELGGKNPQIVCADADLDAALDAVVFGVCFNAGECCNSGSRVLVHRDIAGDFAAEVVARARRVPVGDPLDPATKVGAIVSDEQLAVIERYVAEGRGDGAELLLGGGRLATGTGRFYQPTVFAGVGPGMSIAGEEIFGPVLSVLTFHTLDEAVEIANSTMYGLSAGIWTSDLNAALTASQGLRAGTIWVNRWMDGYPELPFGGYKASGEGRELGRQAIGSFTQTKTIQLQVGARRTRWVPGDMS